MKALLTRVTQAKRINFLLTNRIPRKRLTRFAGWWSRIRQPLVRDLSIAVFRLFADDLELHEARKARFESLHDLFVRELKPGARSIDPDPRSVVSPCDGIVGASGRIRGTELIQAKGFPYTLEELLHDPHLVDSCRDGYYVTLRLKVNMYHRFHAPHDCRVEEVTYISGDAWNVNPPALGRIEKLFCRNERVVIRARLKDTGQPIVLVAVAAVMVASVRLSFLDVLLHLRYAGPNVIPCDANFSKGDELGHFQHGSTIILFAPPGAQALPGLEEGRRVRMGQPLLRLP